jgi:hypothetical protein
MLLERAREKEYEVLDLPFGYYLERYADLLMLRRADDRSGSTITTPIRLLSL